MTYALTAGCRTSARCGHAERMMARLFIRRMRILVALSDLVIPSPMKMAINPHPLSLSRLSRRASALTQRRILPDDVPVAAADIYLVDEDTPVTGRVTTNDHLSTDGDGTNVVTVAEGDGPTHGTLSMSEAGVFVYTPEPNYFGPDSFTYTLSRCQWRYQYGGCNPQCWAGERRGRLCWRCLGHHA